MKEQKKLASKGFSVLCDFVKHDLKGALKCIEVTIWTHSLALSAGVIDIINWHFIGI
jgi:hypothetical protein